MIIAGKCQDKFGPRITAFLGGLLVGLGFIWISQTTSYLNWVIGFGVLAGTGIGFGYSAATPPALKWFPPEKTGLIAGIVVSGFGLASVYIAPVSNLLLIKYGLQNAMLYFGVSFLLVVCGLSMFLENPPKDFIKKSADLEDGSSSISSIKKYDYNPSEMIKSSQFYILWFIYFIGAGAGLMVIGNVAEMAKRSLNESAFLVVAIMAVGNAAGRIFAGYISDKIGRRMSLIFMLLFQSILMFGAISVVGSQSNPYLLVILATLIGFNYGTNLSLFPSITKDIWGLKNFGTNYGIVFTAWGVGGFVMGRLSQILNTSTGSFKSSFLTAGVMLIIGSFLSATLKTKKQKAFENSFAKEVA
jgi:MFS family permease